MPVSRPGEGDAAEAEGVLVEVRGLGGVADEHLDVVDAVERHVVRSAGRWGLAGGGLGRHRISSSSGSPL